MANVKVNDATLTAIADAIRSKSSSQDTFRPGDMAQAILDIPSGGPVEYSDVNFIDCDGKLIYAYTIDEIQAMTELPPLPQAPSGLTAVEWNWTLSGLKAHNGRMMVGAWYLPADGKTHMILDVVVETTLSFSISTYPNSGTVDWDDGTTEALASGNPISISHTFQPGQYDVKFDCSTLYFRKTNSSIVGVSNNTVLKEIWFANNHGAAGLDNNHDLERVTGFDPTLPLSYSQPATTINTAYQLKALILKRGSKSAGAIHSCYSLEHISFGEGLTTPMLYIRNSPIRELYLPDLGSEGASNTTPAIADNSLSSNVKANIGTVDLYTRKNVLSNSCRSNSLQRAVIADGVTSIGADAFYGDQALQYVEIAASVTSIQAFQGTRATFRFIGTTPPTLTSSSSLGTPRKIYVPAAALEDYKTATNYAQFADVMEGY